MRRSRAWSLTAVVLACAAGWLGAAPRGRGEPVWTATVVKEYPHDPDAFCQGLVYDDELLEGTGQFGKSSLRRVDLDTGRVIQRVDLDQSLFGEGIAVADGSLFQITWKNRIGYVYDRKTLKYQRTFRYSGQGWGLAFDGRQLIMSDGSSTLQFMEPATFKVVRRVSVRGSGGPVENLNELEFVDGEVWSNIWYSDRIARIDPASGKLLGWVDLSNLYPANTRASREAVLNGIAYDAAEKRLFVTGKNWPKLFEIRVNRP